VSYVTLLDRSVTYSTSVGGLAAHVTKCSPEQEVNMALPLGDWRINANGYTGVLHIAAVNQGNVTGTLTFAGEAPNQLNNVAFWNDTSKEITFIRVINPADPSTFQIYTGFFFPQNHTQPNGPSELAGHFEAFRGTGGSANRSLYGWFASHAAL
jgi:hypothetical protein